MDEEQRLKSGLAAGDAACYGEVYDRHGAALFRTAMRILGNQADAEDAVQETFSALVRGRGRIGGVADLKAYIFASLRRAAFRISRNRRRRPAAALDESVLAAPQDDVDAEAERLWALAAALPGEQREVLAMKIQAELTFEQIGGMLGVSPNTAASRYRYALQKLQQMAERQQ
ncbi:MAG: sigma-70 family RNA polymerase sigma factor [Planctomycetes bacterium]|nr:sigma-70 family RNA polymerase sigma factor [Planctomycetota bacterium]